MHDFYLHYFSYSNVCKILSVDSYHPDVTGFDNFMENDLLDHAFLPMYKNCALNGEVRTSHYDTKYRSHITQPAEEEGNRKSMTLMCFLITYGNA